MNPWTTYRIATWTPVVLFALFSSVLAQEKPDLSLPTFDPKPVVWVDDWKPAEQESDPKRDKASQVVRTADQLKSANQYEKAEAAYLEAATADPSWGYPHYQLACNYELWGR